MIGTIARMLRVDALDADRYALIAVGTRRIAVNAWLPDDPYPIADVDDWPDDDPDAPGLDEAVRRAHGRVKATLSLAAEVEGEAIDASDAEVSDDPLVASYHLAAIAPIGPADRYRLLAAPGPMERIRLLDEVLDDVDAMLKFRLT